MEGQDILFCSLEGDVLTMAKNIVAALDKTTVKRIIWITGMGIHHEITGVRGMMLNRYAKQRPDCGKQGSYYITALSRNTELLLLKVLNDNIRITAVPYKCGSCVFCTVHGRYDCR